MGEEVENGGRARISEIEASDSRLGAGADVQQMGLEGEGTRGLVGCWTGGFYGGGSVVGLMGLEIVILWLRVFVWGLGVGRGGGGGGRGGGGRDVKLSRSC